MKEDETLDPLPIGIFGSLGVMVEPAHLTHLFFEAEFGVWNKLAWCGICGFHILGC
jgi:hypothetical protein